ncbi:adenylyl cyclase-associated protein 1 [Fopius arisanus]|uniref:Adenylyl cyclase-associated protein 1 n=3 Tax=Fopius arisanus TaxID=64838 RepID=A0A9R1SVN6_9HYME|nr:PREDICTED: adenylyl cyclase-associated protein 1 [Fopius arisanus]
MFSCCVCNKASKKAEGISGEPEDDEKGEELETPEGDEGKTATISNAETIEKLMDPEDADKDEIDKVDVIESRSLPSEGGISELPEESPGGKDPEECNIPLEKGPPKTVCLFEAPAYIERTIKDGPDEDGDDSVFESSVHIDDLGSRSRKSTDVLSECNDAPDNPPGDEGRSVRSVIRWLSQEEDDVDEACGGMQEPPATPVAKDELALRRHRFFSDLIDAAKHSAEHRVRFDPLGPLIHPGCDTEREDHLEELVTRLENVTNRLEVLPSKLFILTQETGVQTQGSSPKRSDHSSPDTLSIESVVELVSRDSEDPSLPSIMSIVDYEDLLNGPVAEFLQLSRKIGGDVEALSKLVEKAFQTQLEFLRMATTRCAPANQSEQMALLSPTSLQIQAIQKYPEKNRGSQYFNHLSAINASISALGWVAVSLTPGPYVKEMNDAGQFYTNRVLRDWKETDKTHVEWCKAWVQILTDLQKYVKQHHTTGLVWAKTGSAPPPPPPGAMPPPPPCMPIGDVSGSLGNDDRSALFAQINQGENITKSLKKVTLDMQTHKNSSLRTGPAPFKAPVVSNSSNSATKTVPPASQPIDKLPSFTRDGKKWFIEYQKGNKDLFIDNPGMQNVVYMYRCQDSILTVKGKINSIVIDSCHKSSIVFDSVVSSIEFVNCQSIQMQVLGEVPTISIDKTDGCQMYLSPESLNVELITSKSSEMNVMVPTGNEDYTEYPVPEQFKTTVNRKGLSTIPVSSLG